MIKKLLTVLLMAGMGVFLLVYGFKEYRQTKKLQAQGRKTTGHVTYLQERTGRRGRVSYYLTANFKTETGETIEKKSRVGSTIYSAAVHSHDVSVCYLPADPTVCRFGSEVETEVMPMGLGVFLLGCSVVTGLRRKA